jgi:hypothetical protein
VQRPDTTPERKTKALQQLQRLDPPLQDDQLVAIMDLFTTDTNYADTYLAIEKDSTRQSWLRKRLREAGFPDPNPNT